MEIKFSAPMQPRTVSEKIQGDIFQNIIDNGVELNDEKKRRIKSEMENINFKNTLINDNISLVAEWLDEVLEENRNQKTSPKADGYVYTNTADRSQLEAGEIEGNFDLSADESGDVKGYLDAFSRAFSRAYASVQGGINLSDRDGISLKNLKEIESKLTEARKEIDAACTFLNEAVDRIRDMPKNHPLQQRFQIFEQANKAVDALKLQYDSLLTDIKKISSTK